MNTAAADRTPTAGEFLTRPKVMAYIERVLGMGGRIVLAPSWPYFGVIPAFRMGPATCVRCGERPVRMPLGRRGRRASTCTVCGHRRRDRAPEALS